jgi:hypothetical protein
MRHVDRHVNRERNKAAVARRAPTGILSIGAVSIVGGKIQGSSPQNTIPSGGL